MAKKSVFCIATSRDQADQIADHLKTESFSNRDVSVLFPDKGATGDFVQEKDTKAQQGPVAGLGTGVIVGGGLGWIAGIGPLAITGVGPCTAAGPVAVALNGPTGGIASGLVSLGVPRIEASQYEGKVKEGNILLSVHTEDVGDIARARDIFKQAGAQDICTTASVRKDKKSTTANPASPLAERSFST
jgi:hypothetical protein